MKVWAYIVVVVPFVASCAVLGSLVVAAVCDKIRERTADASE